MYQLWQLSRNVYVRCGGRSLYTWPMHVTNQQCYQHITRPLDAGRHVCIRRPGVVLILAMPLQTPRGNVWFGVFERVVFHVGPCGFPCEAVWFSHFTRVACEAKSSPCGFAILAVWICCFLRVACEAKSGPCGFAILAVWSSMFLRVACGAKSGPCGFAIVAVWLSQTAESATYMVASPLLRTDRRVSN